MTPAPQSMSAEEALAPPSQAVPAPSELPPRVFIGDYHIQDIEGREYGRFYLHDQPFHCHQYLSLQEATALISAEREAGRREALLEFAANIRDESRKAHHGAREFLEKIAASIEQSAKGEA